MLGEAEWLIRAEHRKPGKANRPNPATALGKEQCAAQTKEKESVAPSETRALDQSPHTIGATSTLDEWYDSSGRTEKEPFDSLYESYMSAGGMLRSTPCGAFWKVSGSPKGCWT